MLARNATPGPSCECDITFVKGRRQSAQQLHDNTVAAHRARSVTVPSSQVTRECRSPVQVPPPSKMADNLVRSGKTDLVQFQRGLKQGSFARSFFPLRHRTLERENRLKRKFISQKSPFQTRLERTIANKRQLETL